MKKRKTPKTVKPKIQKPKDIFSIEIPNLENKDKWVGFRTSQNFKDVLEKVKQKHNGISDSELFEKLLFGYAKNLNIIK